MTIKKRPAIARRFLFVGQNRWMVLLLFSIDNGFVDSIPTGGIETPIVGGVLVAIDSHFSSLDLFVSINTHDMILLIV